MQTCIAIDDLNWQKAYDAIQCNERIVYVLPRDGQPLLSLIDVLRELFALQEINNDASLRQHDDRERIQRHLSGAVGDVDVADDLRSGR